MHAEMRLGDSVVMFGNTMPGYDAMPASLSYYVDDGKAVDATYEKAVKAGATSVMPPADQFYGYRSATVKDPGGNKWTICAVIESLTPAQIQERMAKMTSKGGAKG
jgi:PhnB protein